ncbi:hypothetical protein LINPERHAP1_LOCUS36856 [Linum perenne]
MTLILATNTDWNASISGSCVIVSGRLLLSTPSGKGTMQHIIAWVMATLPGATKFRLQILLCYFIRYDCMGIAEPRLISVNDYALSISFLQTKKKTMSNELNKFIFYPTDLTWIMNIEFDLSIEQG